MPKRAIAAGYLFSVLFFAIAGFEMMRRLHPDETLQPRNISFILLILSILGYPLARMWWADAHGSRDWSCLIQLHRSRLRALLRRYLLVCWAWSTLSVAAIYLYYKDLVELFPALGTVVLGLLVAFLVGLRVMGLAREVWHEEGRSGNSTAS